MKRPAGVKEPHSPAAVSLLVFFWCSSGFFWVLLVFFCVIEHQKNTRRTPEEPRRTQKEKNTSPPGQLDSKFQAKKNYPAPVSSPKNDPKLIHQQKNKGSRVSILKCDIQVHLAGSQRPAIPQRPLPSLVNLWTALSRRPTTVKVPPIIAQSDVIKSYQRRPFDETTTAMGLKS